MDTIIKHLHVVWQDGEGFNPSEAGAAVEMIDILQAEIERLKEENRTLRIDNERNLNELINLCHIRAVAHDEIRRLHVIEQSHSLCPEVIDGLKDEISRLQGILREVAEHEHCDSGWECHKRNPIEHFTNTFDGQYRIGLMHGHRCAASIAKKGLPG